MSTQGARFNGRRHGTVGMMALCGALGCGSETAPGGEETSRAAEALRVEISSSALAYDFAHRDNLITAAAGNSEVVFVAEPLVPRVAVLDRVTGVELGEVPPPPGGWLLPFALRVPDEDRLVVLDPGGFPSPEVPAVARVYDYQFDLKRGKRHARRFEAELTRSVRFDGLPLVFAEDVEVTPSGHYVVAESILGAIWVIAPDGSISPGLFPGAAGPIAPLAPCTWPTVEVGGIPFATAGNFAPGVVAVAEQGGQVYFSATCGGGLYRVPFSTLIDSTRAPDARASDIEVVSARPEGEIETLHGLAFDRSRPRDGFVYATDSLHLRVLRIDTRTGERETVASDPVLFNFPVKPQFLPPIAGVAPLLVPSDQEHRFAAINAAIPSDQFQPPWIVTKVIAF
jgi:hypothetical protein